MPFVREAHLRDLKAIQTIEDACFGGLPEHCTLYDYAEVLAENPRSVIFVAGCDGVVAATGMMTYDAPAEITNLAVLPKYRRIGLGRRLMVTMLACAKAHAHKTIVLDVRKANPAVDLYKSMGFKVVRSLDHEWYLMRWNG
jgi:[ribosomal protein S18]-alanine N-acetyltransferase